MYEVSLILCYIYSAAVVCVQYHYIICVCVGRMARECVVVVLCFVFERSFGFKWIHVIMDKICRLCYGVNMVKIPIFNDEYNIYRKISLCLPVKPKDDDHLPKNICIFCKSKLDEFHFFWKKSLECELRLIKLVQSNDYEKLLAIELKNLKSSKETVQVKTDHDLDTSINLTTSTSSQTDGFFTDDLKLLFAPIDGFLSDVKEEINSVCSDKNLSSDDLVGDIPSNNDYGGDSDENTVETNRKTKLLKTKNVSNSDEIVDKGGDNNNTDDSGDDDNIPLVDLIEEFRSSSKKRENELRRELVKLTGTAISKNTSRKNNNIKAHKIAITEVKTERCCCICYKFCDSKFDMLKHYETHKFGLENKLLEELKNGSFQVNENGQYKCSLCDSSSTYVCTLFDKKEDFESHIRQHKNYNHPYKCSLCELVFLNVTAVYNHGKKHQFVACSLESCPTSHTGLCPESHKLVKDESKIEKSFLCDICKKSFARLRLVKEHRLKKHPKADLKKYMYPCNQCPVKYSMRWKILRHMKTHEAKRNICFMCGKVCKTKATLKYHIITHKGQKKHVCNICGKGFAHQEYLVQHKRTHTGEKPYKCKECGRGFTQKSPLVIHMRVHSGERPYKCKICKKGFASQGILTTHLKKPCK